jgi:hypothetical protein
MVVEIKNLTTGISCECSNLDVIRICEKDPKNYKVTKLAEKGKSEAEEKAGKSTKKGAKK